MQITDDSDRSLDGLYVGKVDHRFFQALAHFLHHRFAQNFSPEQLLYGRVQVEQHVAQRLYRFLSRVPPRSVE